MWPLAVISWGREKRLWNSCEMEQRVATHSHYLSAKSCNCEQAIIRLTISIPHFTHSRARALGSNIQPLSGLSYYIERGLLRWCAVAALPCGTYDALPRLFSMDFVSHVKDHLLVLGNCAMRRQLFRMAGWPCMTLNIAYDDYHKRDLMQRETPFYFYCRLTSCLRVS